MRPLIRPQIFMAVLPGEHSAFHLMNHYGHYCAFSEEPIFDTVATWNLSSNPEIPLKTPLATRNEPVENSLPIAPATFDSWNRNRWRTESFLRPDDHLTFALSNSAFTYNLEEVEVIFLGEDDEPVQTEVTSLAIVRGSTAEANATIDLFALNTEFFDKERRQLRMPHTTYLSRVDHRMFNRTDTWARASMVADWIAESPQESRSELIRQAGGLASLAGFWSVWATLFLNRFQDDKLVQQMLNVQEIEIASETSRGSMPGSGIHNIFPNTHPGWMS